VGHGDGGHAGVLASAYLLMSMLLGGHFTTGYVWILPNGGYEFGVFWAAMIAVFVVLGGGRNSADGALWRSAPARRFLPSVVLNVLANYESAPGDLGLKSDRMNQTICWSCEVQKQELST
jgi:hypothetical protein